MPSAPSALAITGFSMVTPLGLDGATSCAAARAGISRTTSLPHLTVVHPETFELEPVSVMEVPCITEGFTGLGRLTILGSYALRQLLTDFPIQPKSRTGLFVNLSSSFFMAQAEENEAKENRLPFQIQHSNTTQRTQKFEQKIISNILALLPLSCSITRTCSQDQIGFIKALQWASVVLQQNKAERCIIGGVDSLVETSLLHTFNKAGVLKTPSQSNGFIAGEGAGFLMLERLETARRRRAPILGIIPIWTESAEPFHRLDEDKRALGVAMSQSVQQILASLPDRGRNLSYILSALNGDAYRATDWGYATIRTKAQFPDFGNQEIHHPVIHFGETNAAHAFLTTGLALRGFARQYLPPSILVALQNDHGERGTFLIQRA